MIMDTLKQVGPKKAKEMWFLSRFYSAYEAEKMGLVNAVVKVCILLKKSLFFLPLLFSIAYFYLVSMPM